MTHDPTRDCEHGRLKGKCDVCDLQEEVVVQSLQCAHCHVTIETLNDKVMRTLAALKEWSDKTDWVQETAQPLELGMHRADVLKQRIEHLNKAEQQAPDYAWPTIEDYEKEVGFEVNDAFKAAWTMARTTNDLFKQMGENA